MNEKKPRILQINIAVQNGDTLRHQWDARAQKFTLVIERNGMTVSADAIDMSQYYERPTKPKFISAVSVRRSRDFSISQSDLVQNYDHVWSIDNSSMKAFGVTFNVAALCALDPGGSGGVERVGGVLFGKTAGNPERYGWRHWIQYLLRSVKADERYAIIVDSEFSLIPNMNARSEPVHGKFMLPENFDLIYATADAGGDQIFNKALSESDKLSKAMRHSMESENNAKYFFDIDDEEAHQPLFVLCASEARSVA